MDATRKCKGCGRTKPIEAFYRCRAFSENRMGKCKCCYKKAVAENYRRNREHYVAYERERFQRPERKAQMLRYQKQRRSRFPGKYRARQAVGNAIRDGRLTRPGACSSCLTPGRVQAHHHDYRKPFDVKWLCFKCHREQEHGQVVVA